MAVAAKSLREAACLVSDGLVDLKWFVEAAVAVANVEEIGQGLGPDAEDAGVEA